MKKKLIILINQAGTYKGGAQKRYLNLFSHLQKYSDEYYLLLNDSLFDSVFNDKILKSTKNVLHLHVKFERFVSQKETNIQNNKTVKESKITMCHSSIYNYLGALKYLVKCLYSCLCYSIELNKLLNKNKFSSIYCVYNGGIWSWFLLRIKKIDYLYSYNDANFGLLKKSYIRMFGSDYFALKYAKFIDCLSPALAEGLKKRFPEFYKDKFMVTPNSFIDYTQFKPIAQKENWICFCSRLEELKNPYLLIEAISLIRDKMKDYKVMIIGNGNEYIHLQEGIENNNLGNIVQLCGALESSEPIVSRSKIFVSVQQDNNYPSQSLLEAMACENAIIASDVGETRVLVTEKEGVLIPLSAQKLAEAILMLMENETLCREKGKSAHNKATTEHTIEAFVTYFEQIMDKI